MHLVFSFAEERQLAEGDDVFSRDGPGDGGGGGDGSSGHSDSDIDGDGGVAIRGTLLPLIHGNGGRCTRTIEILFLILKSAFDLVFDAKYIREQSGTWNSCSNIYLPDFFVIFRSQNE